MKYFLLFCFFSTSVFFKAQKIDYQKVNNNIDNYSIREIYEDTLNFHSRNILSVKHYKSEDFKKNIKPRKQFNGKDFFLQSITEYLPDGRKQTQQKFDNEYISVNKYYYDDYFNNLILNFHYHKYHEYSETNSYYWIFYNEQNL